MEGFMRFTWSNNQVYPDIEPGTTGAAFIQIFRASIGPIPLIVVVMILMSITGHFGMTRTRFGIESKLVDSARASARTTDINVPRVIKMDFLGAAFCASIAGIIITSMNKLEVFYLGKRYDFKSVTAVVIGGMMLSGGRGNMLGAFGGVLVIGLLANITESMGVNTLQQNIVTGSTFIIVVGVASTGYAGGGKIIHESTGQRGKSTVRKTVQGSECGRVYRQQPGAADVDIAFWGIVGLCTELLFRPQRNGHSDRRQSQCHCCHRRYGNIYFRKA
jgi:branched-subunit amino acid ABC-type transport system permease component